MKSGDARNELERFISARGSSVGELSVRQGIDTMVDFYRTVRADDCELASDGDMLLFQWGTYDHGRGRRFIVDITRQFTRGDGEDEDIWQLSLTFAYAPTEMASGHRWCESPDGLQEFMAFVGDHAALALVADTSPMSVDLELGPAG